MPIKTKRNCKHKRTVLATASFVRFEPDQEPFEADKIECAGVAEIEIESVHIHYCPICKTIQSMEWEGNIITEVCSTDHRCQGHE